MKNSTSDDHHYYYDPNHEMSEYYYYYDTDKDESQKTENVSLTRKRRRLQKLQQVRAETKARDRIHLQRRFDQLEDRVNAVEKYRKDF